MVAILISHTVHVYVIPPGTCTASGAVALSVLFVSVTRYSESTSSSDLSYPHVPTTVLEVDTQDMNASGFLNTTLPHELPGNRNTPYMQQFKPKQGANNNVQPVRNRARAGSDGSVGDVAPVPKKRGRRQGQCE